MNAAISKFFDDKWPVWLSVLVSVIIGYVIYRILKFFLKRYIDRQSIKIKADNTRYYFLYNSLGFICMLIAITAILLNIPELKKVGLGLLTSAGIFAAIIGFASQAAFSNIISGVFIVVFKPFKVGDVLKIQPDYLGEIEDITLRHTVIRDFENKRYIIPNSFISSEVLHNYSIDDERISNLIIFGVSYDSDIDLAMSIIQEEAEKHPLSIDVRTEEEKQLSEHFTNLRIVQWAESSVNIRLKVWAEDVYTAFDLKTDLLKSVFDRFKAEGIEIPYPHRSVIIKKQ